MKANIDLIIDFQVPKSKAKQQSRDNATKAEQQYTTLLETLSDAGLRAVGKPGKQPGTILVCVSSPLDTLARLVRRERCAFKSLCHA